METQLITNYFKNLSEEQVEQFTMLESLYKDWNAQINVISRKDIEELYLKHVLHSLAIAKVVDFKDGTKILDVGTGGGFPGIPLAILYPNCQFVLVDSIGKKIKVVNEIADRLGLSNIKAYHQRAEEVNGQFDFIVTRAVTSIAKFLPWVKGKLLPNGEHELKNGILFLKGGDLAEEIAESNKKVEIFPISNFFDEEFFETKVVAYTRVK
ncbi:MAG: 16S rRNA (guanine(527)-N(7))-methyltransferase RsmG [Bacteroidetes bacterium HGW-Bacteroidetes-12]|nr:MAG: 16S rRNA (guanine(527)-N(7))-methyltransferase RsmG [Bacteroidetes bacterium HGW-Bacteroidetes-12]